MNLRPADARRPEAVPVRPEATTAATASHEASVLHGATSTGEAAGRQLSIRVGLWLDDGGGVRRARFRPVADPGLRDIAEVACSLLEAGADPLRLDADSLRSAAAGVVAHGDRADLVAAAIQTAMSAARCSI